ncbi:MAG: NfeD family protein [Clostridium sp.]|nr:NfeD family protein [Clostridium sp.]
MMIPSAVWLILLVILVAGEAITVGLTFIWFAVGAMGGLLTAVLGGEIWLQVVVFLLLSAVTLILVRPAAAKLLTPGISPTNADRVLSQIALVTEEINNIAETGQVKLFGQVWTARSENGEVIPVQSRVRILRIEGVKVFVKAV